MGHRWRLRPTADARVHACGDPRLGRPDAGDLGAAEADRQPAARQPLDLTQLLVVSSCGRSTISLGSARRGSYARTSDPTCCGREGP